MTAAVTALLARLLVREDLGEGDAAALMRARSSCAISWPVGLFGVLRKIIRVRGVMASRTACVGNAKSGPGGTRTAVAPTAAVAFGYGSNAGSGTIVSASCARGRAMCATAAISSPSSSPLVSSTHSGSTSKWRAHAWTTSEYSG